MKEKTDDGNLFYDNEEYEKIKKKTLFKILLSVFIKTLFESFLQPLLPFYILNYYDIQVKELGILLSFYSLAQCVMCLVIGLFSSINKKHLLVFLILLNLIGMYLFYVKLNFSLLIINRIICGSSSVFIVVVNAMINDLVDTDVCIYYTYINIFNAIGIILGPLLSSLFLTIFNFQIILNFNTLGLIASLLIVLTISSELLAQNQDNIKKAIIEDANLITLNVDTHGEKKKKKNVQKNISNKDGKNDAYLNDLAEEEFINNRAQSGSYKHEVFSYRRGANSASGKLGGGNSVDEYSINSYLLNKKKKKHTDPNYKKKLFHYDNDEFSELSYQQFLKRRDYFYITRLSLYLKEKMRALSNATLSYKLKCLLSICMFRFTSAFSSNLMSNIFFVFYNDNVSSDNKQIQISVFVSLSGIIMIFYQYFSFSYILKTFGYNGTAIIGLLIQSTGILLTYHSIKYYNIIFQYISICFIHSCSYAYIEPIIPTIISLFFSKRDQLFSQSIVSFFRYLSLTISPIIYSYYYIENQLSPFFISSCVSIISIFFVHLSFKYHKRMNTSLLSN
ncbi:major facilitator superfamily, putative [Plasmodium knowlesi strain H]|uniref:Major facilitator superfamily, putative n=3 Tax=Plasmodium knowlesi TaxID=5850 RepID=A0A5K1UI31_PLAKH|nr:major facilitator superfamily domain-containing protein, putative [Plasmodium knowlesi strain H]OTN65345.1 putative Major Facilitator Superfamily [Plasmodium knowlesi]CAA9989742.1 major facilitator superfamily domain-containing protein, putative [Plasmodium knowlesi strain H]SBO22896.1 major facilitator superfamily, putative [Plasmodium knowlesi strain H]SBO23005.1 major facilitator superfamily, putative [Plasmodium knowlesi strain H]VVS79216.1 major facilitator superfamily domain-containin|eukprot:XP_002260465.1 Major Facilitator Superfamily, putative [Plasmodium knowlesi strain H]